MTNRGGKRQNAGRKAGSNAYGESTRAMRIPLSQTAVVSDFLQALRHRHARLGNVAALLELEEAGPEVMLPLYGSRVAAGFPSPADDHVEQRLSPNDYLIQNDSSSFFVRVKGDSMIDAGIFEGDVLVVDRSRDPQIGDIVLAALDGEFTVKTLGRGKSGVRLIPANRHYPVIEVKEGQSFEVWGVVTGAMRKFA